MSKVLSLRLKDKQVERLGRMARRLRRTPSETATLLLEEALREAEFAFLEFRDSIVGRQAYIKGTGLTVWEIIMVLRSRAGGAGEVADLLEVPPVKVQAAMRYAEAFPEEIESALAENDMSEEELRRLLPNLEVVAVDAPPAG